MNKILNKAKEIALELPKNNYRLCAIITDKRGKILSIGVNSYNKTHPTQAYYASKSKNKNRIYLHAEMDAIIKCKGKAHTIYIARVGNNNSHRLAKPCEICYNAIRDIGIKNIIHT